MKKPLKLFIPILILLVIAAFTTQKYTTGERIEAISKESLSDSISAGIVSKVVFKDGRAYPHLKNGNEYMVDATQSDNSSLIHLLIKNDIPISSESTAIWMDIGRPQEVLLILIGLSMLIIQFLILKKLSRFGH